ncbi:MAG: cell division protein ZapA [Oscillospiraceae bacterium]|nr:cell division protein ZapA [Oscillospiraceae bacterium]
MSEMKRIKISVAGTDYTLLSQDDERYVKDLAETLNEALQVLTKKGTTTLSALVLTALNYLDEYNKASEDGDNLRAQIADYANSEAKARAELSSVRKENEKLVLEVAGLRKENENLDEELDEMRDENEQLSIEIEDLQEENEKLKIEIEELREKLKKAKEMPTLPSPAEVAQKAKEANSMPINVMANR